MTAIRIIRLNITVFILGGLIVPVGKAGSSEDRPTTATASASRPVLRVANPPLLSQDDVVPFRVPTPSVFIRYKVGSIDRHGLQSHSLSINNETAHLLTHDPKEDAPRLRIDFMQSWGGFDLVHRGRDLIVVMDKQMSRVLFVAEAIPAK